MKKGIAISLEGGEGSGKSTIIKILSEHLRANHYDYLISREPGGVPISEAIREILLTCQYQEMDARTEALLFAAARRQHLVEKVLPAIEEGKIVILDRFVDSSLVYQGMARGIGYDEVLAVNLFAIEQFMPQVTILLDVDPKVGLSRVHGSATREVNKLDLEGLAFHQMVRRSYLRLAEDFPSRMVVVDASKPLKDVATQVIEIVEGARKEER